MFLFPRKYRPLLGLDITTSSVKLIELAMAGGQYRVESYAAEPTPQNAINEKAIVDAEAVGEAIRRAVKRSGAKSGEVAIAISGDAAITKVIQMPRGLRDARPGGSGRDAGRPVHPLPDGRSQLRLRSARAVGEGSRNERRAAGGNAHRQRRAAPGRGEGGGPHREDRRRRGVRPRERLQADDPPDARWRHRSHDRGGRLRRQQHHLQRAAQSEGRLHA